jgi:hypothetical protein
MTADQTKRREMEFVSLLAETQNGFVLRLRYSSIVTAQTLCGYRTTNE